MSDFLKQLGIEEINSGVYAGRWLEGKGSELKSINPHNGELIATVRQASPEEYEEVVKVAQEQYERWRVFPAPKRGEIIRQVGEALRKNKDALGRLVTLESGKSLQEGWGEVQEMIDICDFAVGLSRQLYGLTMHSERPTHRMYEQYHPLGVIGLVTAFNFPVAVWAWNVALAGVCGDGCVWKPSSKTPLTAIATQNIIQPVMAEHGFDGLFNMVVGRGSSIGEMLISDKRLPLVSATGSTRMGRRIGNIVADRLGRVLLELGGNNAIIVTPEAEMKLTIPAIVFGAVGTAGQRCTSTRRIIVHKSLKADLIERLKSAYTQVTIGDPLQTDNLMGPLVDESAVQVMQDAIQKAVAEGGKVIYGGDVIEGDGYYVNPCIMEARNDFKIVQDETFAPILYIIEYETLQEALALHNDVPQGLSSAIFTQNLKESEYFLSHVGSDCGIANVNIGTSGAEIGGAFGGEKETGGGRESGSDSWKIYMRRQTNTINWSDELPLAQGIKFGD
jgi:aldehyde dehydrogenase (NAD+)